MLAKIFYGEYFCACKLRTALKCLDVNNSCFPITFNLQDGDLGVIWAPTQDGGWYRNDPLYPQVPFLRFESIKGQEIDPGYESGVRVDLGRVNEKYVVLELRKREEVTDDDVRGFLAPFELWDE